MVTYDKENKITYTQNTWYELALSGCSRLTDRYKNYSQAVDAIHENNLDTNKWYIMEIQTMTAYDTEKKILLFRNRMERKV